MHDMSIEWRRINNNNTRNSKKIKLNWNAHKRKVLKHLIIGSSDSIAHSFVRSLDRFFTFVMYCSFRTLKHEKRFYMFIYLHISSLLILFCFRFPLCRCFWDFIFWIADRCSLLYWCVHTATQNKINIHILKSHKRFFAALNWDDVCSCLLDVAFFCKEEKWKDSKEHTRIYP